MKSKLLLSALMLISFSLFGQESSDDSYELRSNEKLGYIIDKNDKKIEGVVKMTGSATRPWDNQKKVKFIAKDEIKSDSKKLKFKKMDDNDLKEYVAIDENGVERKFKMIKFTNKREGISNTGGGIGGSVKSIKNLASTTHLAEVVVEGPVMVYRLYGYPSPVAVGSGDVKEMESAEQNLRDYPSIIFGGEKDKLQEVDVESITELVAKCDVVKTKMEKGEYPSYVPEKDGKKRSGMGKMIKNEVNRVNGSKLVDMSKEIIGDYNTQCGSAK